jgi:hypothetical protein
MARQEGGQCSIGHVSSRKGWLARVAGALAAPWRRVRGGSEAEPAAPEPAEDPRAEELRQKLEESRTVVEEQHEEAASPETPVDQADLGVEERRATVHERARAAADEMRRE